MESKTMDKATVILAILAVLAMIAVLMPKQAEAQEIPPAVQTRAAQVVEKAKEFGKGEQAQEAITDMQEFKGQLQNQLNSVIDPRLAVPTAIPKGRGNRVFKCVERKFDHRTRTWACIKTGR